MHPTRHQPRTARPASQAPLALLRRHIGDPAVSWSVGTWGGIGEFRLDRGEACDVDAPALTAVTARGGLRITPVDDMVALEIRREGRDQIDEIAFCLPAAHCGGRRSHVVAEIGADAAALRPAARDHRLFDLGLGAVHIDACVRVAPDQATLLARLRHAVGQSLFNGGHGAGAAILAASPPRIFRSPLARLEVYAPIPPPGGRSPEGPHSHILPDLLGQRRAHAPGWPIPDSWYCCLSLYPGAPEALPHEDQIQTSASP
ncbi:MAG TPA: hypothetical protein VJ890_03175 [Vineibacter sp.]|nr:hypothetical protein [Vineibacter sp.]